MRRVIRDGFFLITWLVVQYAVNAVKEAFAPHGFDLALFWVFQVVFAAATLIEVITEMAESWRNRR